MIKCYSYSFGGGVGHFVHLLWWEYWLVNPSLSIKLLTLVPVLGFGLTHKFCKEHYC